MKGYLVIFALIPFANVYGQVSVVEQDSLMMEQVTAPNVRIWMEQVTTPHGQVKVQMLWPEVWPANVYNAQLKFLDPNTDELLSDIVYSVGVNQSREIIERSHVEHSSDGTASFEFMFIETGPASVEVRILGIGENTFKDYEAVVFSAEVVPEFVTLALIDNVGLFIMADAVEGSTTIGISGHTDKSITDITLIVTAPNGNIVSVDQMSPDANGNFMTEFKTASPLWKQDGVYTITAQQGEAALYKDTVEVEVIDGVIIPEFATLALIVMATAFTALLAGRSLGIFKTALIK